MWISFNEQVVFIINPCSCSVAVQLGWISENRSKFGLITASEQLVVLDTENHLKQVKTISITYNKKEHEGVRGNQNISADKALLEWWNWLRAAFQNQRPFSSCCNDIMHYLNDSQISNDFQNNFVRNCYLLHYDHLSRFIVLVVAQKTAQIPERNQENRSNTAERTGKHWLIVDQNFDLICQNIFGDFCVFFLLGACLMTGWDFLNKWSPQSTTQC